MEIASTQAVDAMVRELLPDEDYNNNFEEIEKYLSKISGPLLDRIDLHIELSPVPFSELSNKIAQECSRTIRKRVNATREIQNNRFKSKKKNRSNSNMTKSELNKYCLLTNDSSELIELAMNKLNLSARAYDRILKVARTIADMDYKSNIEQSHIAEAIQYRALDKLNHYLD